jgi:hypothetical protein
LNAEEISKMFTLYSQGFSLEDATGLSIKGDVDVHSIYAASLPTSHPSFAPQMHLELLPQWKAPPILDVNVELFIGILSAGNHFAERMAVRKSWMQHKLIKSSHVVARFFVALVRVIASLLPFSNDKIGQYFLSLLNLFTIFYLISHVKAWKERYKFGHKERSRLFWRYCYSSIYGSL